MPMSTIYTLWQDPQLQYPIYDMNLEMPDYIAQCKTIIQNTRQDLATATHPEKIIEANSPFELKPQNENPRNGALLIHGLFDCPFDMKDIGTHLQSQGLLVRSILLPGHGTVPGALLHVTLEEWLQSVRYGIASLSKTVDKIFLVGYSTGASLALHHVLANQSSHIAGLILLAPAIKIYSSLDFTANWHRIISWKWKRASWLHITEENDYARYQSIPFNAVYQVYRLTQAIQKLSKQTTLQQTSYVILTKDDKTISSQAAIRYFQQHSPEKNQMLIYANHMTNMNHPRMIIRPAAYPDLNIINFAHISLPIAPDNPHYGRNGDYVDASHVDDNKREKTGLVYGTLDNVQGELYHQLYRMGWMKHRQMRLTFNPDFEFLKKTITQFIEEN